MYFNNIPLELKNNALFCVWKLDGRGKIPFNPVTNTYAKSNNPNTFHDYNTIMQYIGKYYMIDADGNNAGGLGLGIFKGYSAIDIDKCIDKHGNVSEMAQDIIEFINSYTEISPSGRGIRIIFKTENKINKDTHYINNRNNGLEIYISDNTNKFVTLTGNVYLKNDINTVDISYILEKYMKKPTTSMMPEIIAQPVSVDIDEKIGKALESNPAFKAQWEKFASGSGGTESEDDLALCNYLARIFEGDYASIDEAFKRSPYYATKDRDHVRKWAREDYRMGTIGKAVTSYHSMLMTSRQSYEFNDTGNAERFANNFRGMVKYNVDNRRWMIWNGRHWQHDTVNHVKNMLIVVVEQMKTEALSASGDTRKNMERNINRVLGSFGKQAMLVEAQHLSGIPAINTDFDVQKDLINTKSGVVNLRTSEISKHDRELMMSKYINLEVSHDEPKLWMKFLNEVYADNPDIIPYLQRLAGYMLTGYTTEQSLYIFLGDGSNGKSLLLETMLKAMGDYATVASSDLLVERRFGSGTEQLLAVLIGARFVMVEETELGDRLKESTIKNLTSDYGDITARFLYGNTFTYKPVFKLVMATNYSPRILGTDHGIWRRIKVVPHNQIFEGKKQDKLLGSKLEKELPEILGWMIKGAKEYFDNGLQDPESVIQRVREYRSEMDLVAQWMMDNCEMDPEFQTPAADLFADITAYLEANNEYKMTMSMFGRNMGKKFTKRRINGKMTYLGLRIKDKTLVEGLDATAINKEDI